MIRDMLLIKRAQKGDPSAFVELIKKDEVRLYNTALKILRNEQDAEDAMQETIISAYRNIRKLKKAEYFYTWIYRILINTCNKLLRNRKEVAILLDDYQKGRQDLSDKEKLSSGSIGYLVEELPDMYKIPILLYYQNRFTVREIAQILEEAEGTIKSRLSRGRALIKQNYTF